jgi:nucleoside-diphosphate-sugar epimerase
VAGELLDEEAMRALVTGSAGFVGQHLRRQLEVMGYTVIPADRKTGIDLTKIEAARACVRTGPMPDVIFHLASSCSTPGSVKRPLDTFMDTVVTAVNILEVARQGNIPVILTSSVKARDGQTPYGAAKVMVETWAREYMAMYDLPVVINRPGTIYGPGQEGSDESGWIAWFCKARDENLEVTINGDGEQVRDLLHVSDYVRLMIKQAGRIELYRDMVWDVGGGDENVVSVNQIARHLSLRVTHGPDREGDARAYIGYNRVPGWEPIVHWWESETLGAH